MEGVRARTAKLNSVMYVYVCNIQYMYVYMFYVYVCVCMNVCVHISTVYECMCLYETVFTCGIGATGGGQAGSPAMCAGESGAPPSPLLAGPGSPSKLLRSESESVSPISRACPRLKS